MQIKILVLKWLIKSCLIKALLTSKIATGVKRNFGPHFLDSIINWFR